MGKSQVVTTSKLCVGKYMLFSLKIGLKGTLLSALKGNNSCKDMQ
jgi:hypothetical protein